MRKFAKISAVLAAMVFALAFVGCNSSSDDDDDDSGSAIVNPGSGVDGTGSQKAYWISEEERADGSYRYAHEYIEFTDATTLEVYNYYDEGDVAKGKSDKVGYALDSKNTCKVDEGANCYTVTGGMFSYYEDGKWVTEDNSDYLGESFSVVYTVSGSEIIKIQIEGNSTFTTKYIKTLTKPEKEYTTGEKVKVEEVAVECWVSKKEKDDGSIKYAGSYIEFTSDTTAKSYKYFNQDNVDDGEAPSVGYFVDCYVTFKTNGNVLTATDVKFYYYEKGVWACDKIEDMVDEGTPWSLTYTISGSEMTEVFTFTDKGDTGTETSKYTKVASKPTEPYKK